VLLDKWQKDLDWSAKAFHDLVWPILQKHIGGQLIHIEQITEDSFAKNFDQLSGIDAWHIRADKGIRGIASRIQVCDIKFPPYNTFTIRKSRDSGAITEYEKRKKAIESQNGWLYPHLTVQAYISEKTGGILRSFAVAKTKNIIEQINTGQYFEKRTGNACFLCVAWDEKLCVLKGQYER